MADVVVPSTRDGYARRLIDQGVGGDGIRTWAEVVSLGQTPGFVTGRWYWPFQAQMNAGAAIATGAIKLVPIFLPRPMAVDQLGAHVTTLAASGNFKLAIYANNQLTGRPTGLPIVQSNAAGSTASAGVVTGAVAANGVVAAGLNWVAIQVDASAGGTAIFKTVSGAFSSYGAFVGTATAATLSTSATAGITNLSVSQAYGSFPDMTSASFTEEGSAAAAVAMMRAA